MVASAVALLRMSVPLGLLVLLGTPPLLLLAHLIGKPLEKPESSSRSAQPLNGEASNAHQTGTTAVPVGTKLSPGLTVQVAALSTQQDAVNMVEVLKARGYPAQDCVTSTDRNLAGDTGVRGRI